MNVDVILQVFNRHKVAYLLIGGMNFLLRHKPMLTYDVDVWVEDTVENLSNCEKALADLNAEWGSSENDWGPVVNRKPGWLKSQPMFCLTSPHGAIDIFRTVKGIKGWSVCNERASVGTTAAGVSYRGLSDEDMLHAQYALDEEDRHIERIQVLEKAVRKQRNQNDR